MWLRIQLYSRYIIEDEPIDTSHEVKTLEAVDREILGDHDTCLYADEPLADEEFYAQYLNKPAQHKEQNEPLQWRLDGLEDQMLNDGIRLNHGEHKYRFFRH